MKKIILMLSLVLIILSGCKKETDKKLICTKNSKIEENDIVEVLETYFVEDKISVANLETRLIVNEKYKEYVDVLEQQLIANYSEYQNKKGIDFSILKGTEDVKVIIKINFKELTESLESLGIMNDDSTYLDISKTLPTIGFVCK